MSEKLQRIVKQIEFYLSDANLRRDAFFVNLLKKDELIDTAVFLNCRKVKALTKEVEEIREAIKLSSKLQLEKDDCFVKRVVPVNFEELSNTNNVPSVFVANLAISANIESVQNMFKDVGEVVFVELKRLGDGTKCAIVEFSDAASADKALQSLPLLNWEEYRTMRAEKKVAALAGSDFSELVAQSLKSFNIAADTLLKVCWKHVITTAVTDEDIQGVLQGKETTDITIKNNSAQAFIRFKTPEDCALVHGLLVSRKALLCGKVVKAFVVPTLDQIRNLSVASSSKRPLEASEEEESAAKLAKCEA